MFTQPQPNVSFLNHISTLFQRLSIGCTFYLSTKTAFQRWLAYTRGAQSTQLQFPWQFSLSQTGCRTVRDDYDRLLEVDLDEAVGQFLYRFLPEQLDLALRARREALLLVPVPLCPRWCITAPTKQHLISNQVVSPLCNLKSIHFKSSLI